MIFLDGKIIWTSDKVSKHLTDDELKKYEKIIVVIDDQNSENVNNFMDSLIPYLDDSKVEIIYTANLTYEQIKEKFSRKIDEALDTSGGTVTKEQETEDKVKLHTFIERLNQNNSTLSSEKIANQKQH